MTHDLATIEKYRLKLGPNEERVLRLDAQGKSYRDIAEELGRPIGTVRSRLNRARARLTGMIEREARRNATVG